MLNTSNKNNLAYIIGVAMGDGNLSNPNGRAVRLRITCDVKYPYVIDKIIKSLKKIAVNNQVSKINRQRYNAIDISCYSNDWENVLGWKAKKGSKIKQNISIPKWIKENEKYSRECLRGLFQTDGSIYLDRGYKMINFVSYIKNLTRDVTEMLEMNNIKYNFQKINERKYIKYTVRITTDVNKFITYTKFRK